MPFDPDIPQKITGYVIVEPGGDRPYFSHSAPIDYVRAKPDARVFRFSLWLPDAPNTAGDTSGVQEVDLTQASIFAAIAAEHARLAKTHPAGGHPNGTGADVAHGAASLLRDICVRAEGAWSYAASLSANLASTFAEVDDDRLVPELVRAGATIVQWIETIRRRQRERRAL
jgi:hypothetical protein